MLITKYKKNKRIIKTIISGGLIFSLFASIIVLLITMLTFGNPIIAWVSLIIFGVSALISDYWFTL